MILCHRCESLTLSKEVQYFIVLTYFCNTCIKSRVLYWQTVRKGFLVQGAACTALVTSVFFLLTYTQTVFAITLCCTHYGHEKQNPTTKIHAGFLLSNMKNWNWKIRPATTEIWGIILNNSNFILAFFLTPVWNLYLVISHYYIIK